GTGICWAWATRFAAALPAAARLAALVTAEPAPQDRPWARPLRRVRGDLRLTAVTVVDADGPLLAAADLHVRPGERVAVVGGPERTRAAVLDLLLRWRDPDAGQVSFDGHDLTELTLDTIRGAVAVVLPVPVPVAGTVADNIRIARPAAGRAEVRAAAETVRLDLRDLPLGLDTPLGADTLDDTRWRLVTIARAVLRDTPVLLAEDPLSGLPETGRRAVRDALDAACTGRTAVTLAADPAGIPPCDRVLRLDRGLLRGDPGTGRVRPRHRVSPGGTR
ncbi:MAG: ABC transporter ATP-binding protein, partial [Pseudonocardiales bacterium]|nr:ABC transporter ATP-binding protein [Pseudonocardiales bacterium]